MNLNFENLHHAYLFEGYYGDIVPELHVFLEGNDVVIQGNPDVVSLHFDALGVEDAHYVRQLQTNRSVTGKRFITVSFTSGTHEAQNALLKVFEEPSEDTHFFVIVPRRDLLLPTLQSRLMIMAFADVNEESPIADQVQAFLRMKHQDRLDFIKKITDKKEETYSATTLQQFLQTLERELYGLKSDFDHKEFAELFSHIELVNRYAPDRGASPKILLEHLALVVPLIK